MVMSYIFEDDLLAHLPFADAAVNLTTLMSPWGMGLSKAYAEKFPEVYKRYLDAQDKFELRLSQVWVDRESEKDPDIICAPVKTLVKDFGNTDNIDKALVDISKAAKDHYDVIMPIMITGDLPDSLKRMYNKLDKDPSVHFWVGISKERAKSSQLSADKKRIFITAPTGFELTIERKNNLVKFFKENNIKSKDIKFVIFGDTGKDWFPGVETIVYPAKQCYIKRLSHYSDMGIAFIPNHEPNIQFNEFIQSVRKEGLDISFVGV